MRLETDAAIVRLAARQHGMVSRAQLGAAGFGDRTIARRLAGGWLTRVHQGVYRVGPIAAPLGDEMAALLACGARAALGDRTAGALWEMRERRPDEVVELLVEGRSSRPRQGIRARRVGDLPAGDVTYRYGLRVTTPVRTLLDLAASTPDRGLARLVEEAQLRRVIGRNELLVALERARGRPGAPRLRAVLARDHQPSLTRSEAERRLLELVRAAGLPAPRTNVRVAGMEVDFLWLEQRLVVEVDGYAFHGSRAAFERDRRRDARLLAHGYRVLRSSWRQIVQEPDTVAATLTAALTSAFPAARAGNTESSA